MTDLSKIATAEPIVLTDGSSQQIAVMTTKPTASSVGLVVREAAQGQQIAANSHPVVIASDQTPVPIGATVAITNPTASADGQLNDIMIDKVGRFVVVNSHARELVITANVNLSTTTETTLFSAGGAGVFLDLTTLVISNDGTTACNVSIRDATGGTVRAIFALGKSATPLSYSMNFTPPWPQTTANNNWTVQLSVVAPTVHVFAIAVKNI